VRVDGSHLQEGDTTARPAIRLLILLSAAVMGPSRIGRFRRGTASIDLGVSEHEARYLRFCGRAAALDVGCVMIIIAGFIVLVAAVVAGVAGVLGNGGSGHALTHGFAVFGYHVTGSTGTLFLYGIVVPRSAAHERQPPVSAAKKIAHRAEAVKGAAMKIAGRLTGNRRLLRKGHLASLLFSRTSRSTVDLVIGILGCFPRAWEGREGWRWARWA
jgi:hypothetical protein